MSVYELPQLPYDYSALEPHYSARQVELHHDKHHATYVKGANDTLEQFDAFRNDGTSNQQLLRGLERSLAFNVSGHLLHSLFWPTMSPKGGGKPEGELAAAVTDAFGSTENLKSQLSLATTTLFGSGWGSARVGTPRRSPDGRTDLRPPEQHVAVEPAAARHRRLGARVLPAVRKQERRLAESILEHRRLGTRRLALRPCPERRQHVDPRDGIGGSPATPVASSHSRNDERTRRRHGERTHEAERQHPAAERAEAEIHAGADRMPTPDEEAAADELEVDPEAAEHYEEMAERGAREQGEGRIP